MKRKSLITVLCFLMSITILMTGCAGQKTETSAPAQAEAVKKDNVTVVEKSDLATLDPMSATDRRIPIYQLYDTLVRDDENKAGEVIPWLAESWEISGDGKEVVFTIRDGVKFHNGDTLTAEDVAFSINTSIASPYTQQMTSSMESAEVVDKNKVKVKLKYAYGPILGCFTCPETSILNKKAYEADKEGFSRNPVGTGAYRLKEWVKGDKIVLEAFPDYFKGKAAINTVTYKVIGDASTALVALEKGEVDVVVNPDQSARASIIANKDLAFYECDANAIQLVSFNNSKGVFSNKKLREAVSYAIDKEAIIMGAKEGVATSVDAPILPNYAGYPDNFKGNPYDVEKAKQLVAEAGYPNGLKVKMKTIDSEIYIKPTEIIQEQLRKIGIDVEIEIMARGKWMEDVVTNADYDITFWAIVAPVSDADFCMYSQFHSSKTGGNGNFAECKIPELDELLEQGRQSQDPKERVEIYRKACNIIKEESVLVPILLGKRQYATNKDLLGVKINPAMKMYSHDWSW